MLLFSGIDLENIVYYKDSTHYFVMTAKKQSLLDKGVIIEVRTPRLGLATCFCLGDLDWHSCAGRSMSYQKLRRGRRGAGATSQPLAFLSVLHQA